MRTYFILWMGCCLFPSFLFAQKHDMQWIFGDNFTTIDQSEVLNINMDFRQQPVSVEMNDTIDMVFYFSRAVVSDTAGNLLFYTNGCRIKDRQGNVMPNGEGLNPGETHDAYCDGITGWNTYPGGPMSMLALPQPGHDSIWYLLHKDIVIDNVVGVGKSYYTIINTKLRGGLGDVVQKNITLDELPAATQLTAAKSAANEAWWIPIPRRASNEFYTYYLDSSGIERSHIQVIGEISPFEYDGGFLARFSPNGEFFAHYNPLWGLQVFDFDRQTGMLSNARFLPSNLTIDSAFWGGLEFSPSGRFLYLATSHYLEQIDLEAPSLAEGKQRVDTYFPGDEHPLFPARFQHPQLGPDCRLYVFCISCEYVHIVHRPDELGTACMVEQRAIQTPESYFRGTPLYPKYRMRPLGDTSSICDHVTYSVFTNTSEPAATESTKVLLYPNPLAAGSPLKVLFNESMQQLRWQLLDGQGRVCYQGREDYLPAQIALSLSLPALVPGIYWLHLQDGTGRRLVEAVYVR